MTKYYKEGDYISYNCGRTVGHGTVIKVMEKVGKTIYLVSFGNGARNMDYIRHEQTLRYE